MVAQHSLLLFGGAATAVAMALAAHALRQQLLSKAATALGILGTRPVTILFGDSITQHSFEDGGWGAFLADLLSRRSDVINRGFGGYNTRWARHLLPSLFPDSLQGQQYLLITLWFGANDAAAPSELAHVPLDEFTDNMRHILRHLQRAAKHVIVLTPPPVHGPTRLAFQRQKYGDKASGVLERTTEQAEAYAKAAVAVAAECSAPVLDVHRLMRSEADWPRFVGGPGAEMQGDGLHLSREGQLFVGRALGELVSDVMGVRPLLDARSPQERIAAQVESLPIELPPGAKMDRDHFARSIAEHRARVYTKGL